MLRYLRIPMTILTFAVLTSITAGAATASSRSDSYRRHDHDYHGRQDGWYDQGGHFHRRDRNWHRHS